MKEIKFKACKCLDFEPNYTAKRQMLGNGKLFWLRPVIDKTYPAMVQFCKKRGRLNYPESCLRKEDAKCNDYEEIEHCIMLNEEEIK